MISHDHPIMGWGEERKDWMFGGKGEADKYPSPHPPSLLGS